MLSPASSRSTEGSPDGDEMRDKGACMPRVCADAPEAASY